MSIVEQARRHRPDRGDELTEQGRLRRPDVGDDGTDRERHRARRAREVGEDDDAGRLGARVVTELAQRDEGRRLARLRHLDGTLFVVGRGARSAGELGGGDDLGVLIEAVVQVAERREVDQRYVGEDDAAAVPCAPHSAAPR